MNDQTNTPAEVKPATANDPFAAHFPKPAAENPFKTMFGVNLTLIPQDRADPDAMETIDPDMTGIAKSFARDKLEVTNAQSPAEDLKYPQGHRLYNHVLGQLRAFGEEMDANGKRIFANDPNPPAPDVISKAFTENMLRQVNRRDREVISHPESVEIDKLDDYQSPARLLDTTFGDCEDIALLERRQLADLGYPTNRMALVGGFMSADLSQETAEAKAAYLNKLKSVDGMDIGISGDTVVWAPHAVLMVDLDGEKRILDSNVPNKLMTEQDFHQSYQMGIPNAKFFPIEVWTDTADGKPVMMSPDLNDPANKPAINAIYYPDQNATPEQTPPPTPKATPPSMTIPLSP